METIPELPPYIAIPRSLRERQAATLAALDSFMEQDEAEHQETLRVLRRSVVKSAGKDNIGTDSGGHDDYHLNP